MKGKPSIADLKHRITVCAADEVVTSEGVMILNRRAAFDAWASITPSRGSTFNRDGAVLDQPDAKPTHTLVMRARHDRDISGAAWIFEARRIGPPRWYRVVDLNEATTDGHFWKLRLRIVQQGDAVGEPAVSTTTAIPDLAPAAEPDIRI